MLALASFCRLCSSTKAALSSIKRCSSVATPSEVRVLSAQKALAVTFTDGTKFSFPAELLRAESPAANSQRANKVPSGRRHVNIIGVEAIGNYGLRITFDDLHSTAIFSWDLLQELGRNKFSRMREYLQRLRAQGGHRGPLLVKRQSGA